MAEYIAPVASAASNLSKLAPSLQIPTAAGIPADERRCEYVLVYSTEYPWISPVNIHDSVPEL